MSFLDGMPQWNRLIAGSSDLWSSSLKRAQSGPRWLVATSVGGQPAVTIIESLLAVALTLRGVKVDFLLCDGALAGCMRVHIGLVKDPAVVTDYRLRETVCPGCIGRGRALYETTGLALHTYTQFLNEQDRTEAQALASRLPCAEIPQFRDSAVAIGEHAMAGALRFLSRGTLDGEPSGEDILRRYFESALLTTRVMQRLLDQQHYAGAVFNHGIYVPQGLIGDVLRSRERRVVNWQVAYRKKCFIFSHHETYHHALLAEPTANWEHLSWSDKLGETTMRYLVSRWHGTEDWIWFHDSPQHDIAVIRRELALDEGKPLVSLLTNVFWDAQLHYRANAYANMLDWIVDSIDYFSGRPELQLVIRIHPAELRGAIKSRQPLSEEIQRRFPTLPANVRVVAPESQVSTYALCEASDSVLIFGTKTGVEMAAMGVPVIVAGEAWIRNKGLTRDASTPAEYRRLLDELPLGCRLPPETIERARKYAFHFFFRRFVPVACVEPATGPAPYTLKIDSLEDLLPGRDPGLDVLCDGIMRGDEFVFPAEKFLH